MVPNLKTLGTHFNSSQQLHPFSLFLERKSIRKSTVKKSEETQLRVKKRKEEGPRKHRRNKDYFYEPTQEEKLAEARLTEEENLKSLGTYFGVVDVHVTGTVFYCVCQLQKNIRRWN